MGPTLDLFAKMSKYTTHPPSVQEGPFREPISKVLRDVKVLVDEKSDYYILLQKVGLKLRELLINKLDIAIAQASDAARAMAMAIATARS